MIQFRNCSIFDVSDKNVVIAHGVNCQGKMASGVAKQIRAEYPKVYLEYMELYNISKIIGNVGLLGASQLIKVRGENNYVANLFTQIYYGKDGSRYADQYAIYCALKSLADTLLSNENLPREIVIPKIGCGLGGLNWEIDVMPVLVKIVNEYPVDLIVCSN